MPFCHYRRGSLIKGGGLLYYLLPGVGVTLGVGDAVVIGFGDAVVTGAEKTIKHDFF